MTVEGYACPLCGSSERRPIPSMTAFARCVCGLVCNARREPPEGYGGEYFTADDPGNGHRNFESASALRYDEERFGEELCRLGAPPGGGRLLDVGSATGSFLATASRHGWRAIGVEISAQARVLASGRGVDSFAGLEDVRAFGPFDVITLHHVVEHLIDPVSTLARLRGILAPAGRVLVEVPNWRSLERRSMGVEWMDLRPEQHRWQFEPRTLRRACTAAGLSVESIITRGEPCPTTSSLIRSLGVPERWTDAWRSRGRVHPSGARTDAAGPSVGTTGTIRTVADAVDAVESHLLLGKRLVVMASAGS